ncbi:MAG: alanine dehydrogenase [Acidobacteriota bacterium]
MKIGVPKERARHEHRVGLTPFGVQRLVGLGHEVVLEAGAGDDAHFRDIDYETAGGRIVFHHDEVFGRSDLICRVGVLSLNEVAMLRDDATICGFLHLSVAPHEVLMALAARRATLVGYELVEDHNGRRPMLVALSEIAGKMAIQVAGTLLQHEEGGRGLVLGGVPGIAPATVVVLGAGTVGRTAAQTALALGAHVIVLDSNMDKLRDAIAACGPHLVTAVASARNLAKYTAIADALIGAVFIPGSRAPFIVTETMVKAMKRGSVIIDLAIDQGGCVETSRPTTLGSPTFTSFGVTHYCVPNMTANAARTASRALALSGLPFLTWMAEGGIDGALRADVGLRRGIYMYRGQVVHAHVAQAMGVVPATLDELLGMNRRSSAGDSGDGGELV